MMDEAIKALGAEIGRIEEQLVMQALAQNGFKVTNARTIARRMVIQVDNENKNKRYLMDGKLILVISTDYKINTEEGNLSVIIPHKIIK